MDHIARPLYLKNQESNKSSRDGDSDPRKTGGTDMRFEEDIVGVGSCHLICTNTLEHNRKIWLHVGVMLCPCSTKMREVLGNPS